MPNDILKCPGCGNKEIIIMDDHNYQCTNCGALFRYNSKEKRVKVIHQGDVGVVHGGVVEHRPSTYKCVICKGTFSVLNRSSYECRYCDGIICENCYAHQQICSGCYKRLNFETRIEEMKNSIKKKEWATAMNALNEAKKLFPEDTKLLEIEKHYKTELYSYQEKINKRAELFLKLFLPLVCFGVLLILFL